MSVHTCMWINLFSFYSSFSVTYILIHSVYDNGYNISVFVILTFAAGSSQVAGWSYPGTHCECDDVLEDNAVHGPVHSTL